MQLEEGKRVPRHVSIIMDGNGRWAQERGLERVKGHLQGVASVRAALEECADNGVEYLSLYAFSTENWGRPDDEVNYLMQLMFKSIMDELENFMANGVRFMVLGNRASLPDILNDSIDKAMEMTAGNKRITMILFISYSGKWDILQAAKHLAAKAISSGEGESWLVGVGEKDFSSLLVTDGIPDPDLIIRTSGEQRLSNYLLWQGAYSEFYFTKVLWPDFDRAQMKLALEEYGRRDRRYGKVK
ncbi:MAG: di-trans,poly-cis-decaprenylcistransferase [Bacteroidales bacterium]|nr:di-trans,poly-cis-decaprenylcistransferase [Bacteroidales bacterium]